MEAIFIVHKKMVTERSTGSKAFDFRNAYEGYLDDFATTVTRRRVTETRDFLNRITGTTSSDVTYKGDIQWVNKADLQHLNMADVEIGDGMLFTEHDADVVVEDTIVHDSIHYRVTAVIEGELVEGKIVFQGFIIKKDAQA